MGKGQREGLWKGICQWTREKIFEGKGWEMAREMTDGDWGKGLGSRLWEKGNANTREMTGGRSWGKD